VITIIDKYIFRELLFPFFNGLVFLTLVFLMTRIPEIIDMVINYRIGIGSILLMFLLKLPRFLEFTIPMSVTISILLTLLRMSGDNEILALKAAGVSAYQLLGPVLFFCFMGTVSTLAVTGFALPHANKSFRQKQIEFARSTIDMALKERQFNTQIDGVMVYATHVDGATRTLDDIVIEDRRTTGMVSISTAPSGKIIHTGNRMMMVMRMYNGMINQVNLTEGSVNSIHFESYDILIDLNAVNRKPVNSAPKIDERHLLDLLKFIRTGIPDKTVQNKALMAFHETVSVPFACIAIGILSFSLGVRSDFRSQSSGTGLGISLFLLYYLLLAAGWSGGENGVYPPVIGMWMPNLVLGGLGILFLNKAAKGTPT